MTCLPRQTVSKSRAQPIVLTPLHDNYRPSLLSWRASSISPDATGAASPTRICTRRTGVAAIMPLALMSFIINALSSSKSEAVRGLDGQHLELLINIRSEAGCRTT
ncbi:hypothetical protein Micbo1qcDRAFT_160253 [Microdochium bolleyi]|uniref:Uncharacterized protein n=1 Tax=Microdochium bolleyi TaxID=196109 RepID=A0A136J5X8_9PEZI|nr:hypothetical protein Micbo1qcDRAFT_160253 [Microdochium bolleyi]